VRGRGYRFAIPRNPAESTGARPDA
jgi:hypothetical protein